METSIRIVELSCDYQLAPIGVEGAPLLRWKIRGEKQSAWRVRVFSAPQLLETADFWDSGWQTDERTYAEYAGVELPSLCRAYWQVDVRGEGGGMDSARSEWKQGVRAQDWQGKWIGLDLGRDDYDDAQPYYCADDFELGENKLFLPPPSYLRCGFELNRYNIREATLYVSAFGLADVRLNGQAVTENHMVPGVCDYRKRVYYQAFDVKQLLRSGENALGCVLADGLYAGYVGLNPRHWWGKKPRLNLHLSVEYEDGSVFTVVSDENWRAQKGAYLYADVMHGTGYDARRELAGYDLPGYDDGAWLSVDCGAEYPHIPSANPGVPIVEHGRYPAKCTRDGKGAWRLDCGRCFSGVLRLRVRGARGARLDIYHAEELKDGELYLRGNRSAEAHDVYILKGEGEEVFQPEFTYHGFRYARVDVQGEAELLSAEGVAISSQLPEPAFFHSENETVNRVYRMIENTRQSNMFDYPTDVNARDERLGWGAEGHFFMHTASRSCLNARFLRKWMRDIADGQLENGAFWATAPAVMMKDIIPFAGDLQSDMGLHSCYLLLMLYEDVGTVRAYLPALERYFEFQKRNSDRLVRFAIARDWLDVAAPDGRSDRDHGYGNCPAGLLGTAYFARSAQMMEEICLRLGLDERAAHYAREYQEIRRMFHVFFGRRDKYLKNATQGGYLAAAAFGLLDEDEMVCAREWVSADFHRRGATWGTATTPVALYGMMKLGLKREACAFIASREYPSIGYMAECGATTVWERWDAIVDGKFHPHPMNAFDHIGLATVGDWMLGGLAGVTEAAPGYRRIRFAPAVDAEISGAELKFESVLGRVWTKWRLHKGILEFFCEIPWGAEGEIILPCPADARVEYSEGKALTEARRDDTLVLTAGPGTLKLRISP